MSLRLDQTAVDGITHQRSQDGITIFNGIKPYCVSLSQIAFAPENIFTSKQLIDALKQLDFNLTSLVSQHSSKSFNGSLESPTIPPSLADYIFVPIAQLLQRSSLGDTELEFILSIINTLIKHCWAAPGSLPLPLAKQFVPLITVLIGGKPNETEKEIGSHSNETLLNGVNCLNSLLQGLENQGSSISDSFLTDNKNLPAIGHMVSVLLNISLKSRFLQLQIESFETLDKLYNLLHDGEILSFLLPGNVSVISKVIKSRPHYKVVCKALKVLTTILSFTFNDFDLDTQWKNEVVVLEDLKDIKQVDVEDEDISVIIPDLEPGKYHRTTSWLRATLFQLRKALKLILDVGNLDNFELRNSLFQLDLTILKTCFRTCGLILPLIIDSISLVCSVDSTFTDFLFDSFSRNSNLPQFIKLINSNLNGCIDSLPFQINSPDISKTVNLLDRIHMNVKLLVLYNDNADQFVVEKLINRLLEEIVMMVQSANSKTNSKISTSTSQFYESEMLLITSSYTNEEFKEDAKQTNIMESILDSEVENAIIKLFETLSTYSNISFILTDLIASNDSGNLGENINRMIEGSVALWIVSTISSFNKPERQSTFDEFIEFEEDDMDVDVDVVKNRELTNDNQESVITLKNNVYSVLQCAGEVLDLNSTKSKDSIGLIKSTVIALHSIGQAADILGEEFRDELIDYLYPVIDNLASPNDLIRNEAQLVAIKLAANLYNNSIRDLIFENHDYLIDSLSVRLTGDSITPRTPMVLNVLIKIGGMDLLNQLDDIIVMIFTLLDLYHGYSVLCEGFLIVFKEVIDQIYKHYFIDFDFNDLENSLQEDSVINHGPWGMKSIEDVLQFLNRKIELPDDILDEPGVDSDDDDEILKKDKKILEVDSDDESDSDNEGESHLTVTTNNNHADVEDNTPKWTSPISSKLYRTVTQIFVYSERLSRHKSINLRILTLKLINGIIPILATQKNRFLPLVASLWSTIANLIETEEDNRILDLAFEVAESAIRYANSFLRTRFVDLFRIIQDRKFYKELTKRQHELYRKRVSMDSRIVINRTSTSTNYEVRTFEKYCHFLEFALTKFGKLLSTDLAFQIVKITIIVDSDPDHYGYFDDIVYYLKSRDEVGEEKNTGYYISS
ncbi:hypothetical protein CANARDRAFT_26863 [[Candida] arabinofermentans NRRL YB-2248]|uniref:Uncharacterized protein n=1 Tax=[Candida] arabinofermentans NRRL YB-2248 TaxID=983967 RepID=A0A1E4T6V1_9ASCO|nr:hypothetical protein CANARDRAFT_26863 [[Candida] arabinofermentans NRRL YB-2248]